MAARCHYGDDSEYVASSPSTTEIKLRSDAHSSALAGLDAAVLEMERIRTAIESFALNSELVPNDNATSSSTSSSHSSPLSDGSQYGNNNNGFAALCSAYMAPTRGLVTRLQLAAGDVINSLHEMKRFVSFLDKYNIVLSNDTCGFFEVLPHEIIQHIFSYVRPFEIVTKVVLLNKHLRAAIHDDNSFWREMCSRHFLYSRHVLDLEAEKEQEEREDESALEKEQDQEEVHSDSKAQRRPKAVSNHQESGDVLTEASPAALRRRTRWKRRFKEYHRIELNWFSNNYTVRTIPTARRVYSVVFSEARRTLWSGNAKGCLQRWDLETGTWQKDLRIHRGAVNCVRLGTRMRGKLEEVVEQDPSERNSSGKNYDRTTTNIEYGYVGHNNSYNSVDMSDDLIFSCSNDGTIKAWRADFAHNDVPLLILRASGDGSSADADSMPFYTDNRLRDSGASDESASNSAVVGLQLGGDLVYSCGLDKSIRLFDVRGGGSLIRCMRDKTSLRCLQIDEREEGGTGCVMTGGSDGFVKVWDPRVGGLTGGAGGEEGCVASLRTGLAKVMTLQFDSRRSWRGHGYSGCTECEQQRSWGESPQGSLWGMRPLYVGGDASGWNAFPVLIYWATDLRMGDSSLWDLDAAKSTSALDSGGPNSSTSGVPCRLTGHMDRIWAMHSCGTRLVTGSRDNTVRVWNLLCPHQIPQIEKYHPRSVPPPCTETNHRDVHVQRYALGDREERHTNSIYWLQFSHRRLVTASADHTIKIWDFACQ